MAKLTKRRLESILTERLGLNDPRFILEKAGSMISGSIISTTFAGKDDLSRQQMIRNAVEDELGTDASRTVGTLLAYTPDEWDIDFDVIPKRPKVRSA